MKDVNYYCKLPYKLQITPDFDYDGSLYYIATYEELEGLSGVGDTQVEAMNDLKEASYGWFEWMIELDEVIPEPITEIENEPVKITYRIPTSLNKQLEKYAKKENISKNNAISALLQKGLYVDLEEMNNKNLLSMISDFAVSFYKVPVLKRSEGYLETTSVFRIAEEPRGYKSITSNEIYALK